MHYLSLMLGVAGVAAVIFGAIAIVKYNRLMAVNNTPSSEKNYIWWGGVILIILGVFVMLAITAINYNINGLKAVSPVEYQELQSSQVISPKSLSSVPRASVKPITARATVSTSPM